MLKYRSLLIFLPAICVTQFATDMDSYVNRGPNQYYNYEVMQDKVDLRVYYESMCPGCAALHNGALDEVIRELGPYLNYKSHPFGNAKMVQQNGRVVIKCQHGEKERYGNKLHVCAIDHLRNPVWSELFNSCMMASHWGGKGSTDMDASRCGASMGINAGPIIRCARSQRGEDLLKYHGQETAMAPNMTYVPFVVINGKRFDGEFGELKAAVCQAFAYPPPPCLYSK